MVREIVKKITPYQPGKPVDELKRELGLRDIVKLASNENPLGPSPKAVLAMKEALSGVNRYPDGNCFYLKSALASKLGVSTDNLVIGNGSNDVLELILRAFAGPGDEVIMGEPSFLVYRLSTMVQGATPVIVPLKEFACDLDGMLKAITKNTKIIFIDNPNNPTGRSVGAKEVDAFVRALPEGVIAVFDEAYNEFIERDDFPRTLDYVGKRDVILVRTFSKAHGLCGLRVGYGVADARSIDYINRVRQPFNVNSLAQVAAAASLEDNEHIDMTRKVVADGKRFLYSLFDKLGLEYVLSDSNFVLVNVRRSGKGIFSAMLLEGVIVRDMTAYKLENFIRVTIGTDKENDKFAAALKKVVETVPKGDCSQKRGSGE